jgi:hypothetical protein
MLRQKQPVSRGRAGHYFEADFGLSGFEVDVENNTLYIASAQADSTGVYRASGSVASSI